MRAKGKLLVLLFLCSLFIPAGVQAADVISEGVYIDGIDVGGLTKQQAKEAEKNYLSELAETKLTVRVNGQEAVTTLGELGYQSGESYAKKAAKLGTEGNLIERYMEITDAQESYLVYEHSFSFDDDLVDLFVSEECAKYNIEAKNAQIHQKKDGSVQITKSKSGSKIVEDETIEKIKRTVLEDWDKTSELVVDAVLVEDMPRFNTKAAKKCTDLLGSFTTEYKKSNEKRCKNLDNAASLINGSVLFSGEEFSVYKALYPITEENGFERAGSFSGGKVVESVGGGICQASTTLYNAVLAAELEVTQRNAHSMAVSYVELGMDAAIAGTYKDLKFTNNLNEPVYIEAVTENKTITFRIWGNEVRAQNRTVDYVSEIVETIEPGEDVITEDPNMTAGTGEVTQEPYKGYKVDLYKVVKVDGKEEQREKISSSEYAATPRYVTVGTAGKKGQEETEEPEKGTEEEAVDGLKDAVVTEEPSQEESTKEESSE
jgi:vancomycin resistance protein YoaR